MALTNAELVFRPDINGRMAYTSVVTGVKNNLFADVGKDDRTAGLITWEKAFLHLNATGFSPLINPKLYLTALTPALDFVTFTPGTFDDTTSTGRHYGVGVLQSNITSGASGLTVTGEHADYATLEPFKVGDMIRISDGTNTDWPVIDTISYVGAVATITTVGTIDNNYSLTNTIVSSVYQPADIQGDTANLTVTSTAGTLSAIKVNNKGSIYDSWTLTFTSATAFTIAGVAAGSVTGGDIGSDYTPSNPSTSSPYFTIQASAWGGTFVAGDTVTFDTNPAQLPLWFYRKVPAGTTTLANNTVNLAVEGESA